MYATLNFWVYAKHPSRRVARTCGSADRPQRIERGDNALPITTVRKEAPQALASPIAPEQREISTRGFPISSLPDGDCSTRHIEAKCGTICVSLDKMLEMSSSVSIVASTRRANWLSMSITKPVLLTTAATTKDAAAGIGTMILVALCLTAWLPRSSCACDPVSLTVDGRAKSDSRPYETAYGQWTMKDGEGEGWAE
jgi:hypothetical protein